MDKQCSILTRLLGIASVVSDIDSILIRHDVSYICDFPMSAWKLMFICIYLVQLCSCLYRILLSYLHNRLNVYYIWHLDISYTTLKGPIHLFWFIRSIYASSGSYSVSSLLFITLPFCLSRTLVSVSNLNTSTCLYLK